MKLPDEVANALDRIQYQDNLASVYTKQCAALLRAHIQAQAASLAEARERECRQDTCCHVQNSADATTQCLEYQGQLAERDARIAELEQRKTYLEGVGTELLVQKQAAEARECEALAGAHAEQEVSRAWKERADAAEADRDFQLTQRWADQAVREKVEATLARVVEWVRTVWLFEMDRARSVGDWREAVSSQGAYNAEKAQRDSIREARESARKPLLEEITQLRSDLAACRERCAELKGILKRVRDMFDTIDMTGLCPICQGDEDHHAGCSLRDIEDEVNAALAAVEGE